MSLGETLHLLKAIETRYFRNPFIRVKVPIIKIQWNLTGLIVSLR